MRGLRFLALVVLCTAAATAQAATLNLDFTFRDFHSGHTGLGVPVGGEFAEFEGNITGLKTGLVSSTILPGGTPTYIGPGTGGGANAAGAINSDATFQGWYTTTPGVNLESTKTLVLDETSPGIFTYDSPAFYPLDGEGFGNEGNAHNYHFTAEFDGVFTYRPGQSFYFRGDDDLFVYIDNNLVIDLGGVHSPEEAFVNLDLLGLTPDNVYSFDLFFAERHTTLSNFKMETSIELISDPVPEASSFALFALGMSLVGLGGWRMRRKAA